jgi:hypothetical protein
MSSFDQGALFFLTEPFNIDAARRAYRQMRDCWKEIYVAALLRDMPVSGARLEIAFEFLGAADGGPCALTECFKAVSWYFQDLAAAFSVLASATAVLQVKEQSVLSLFREIDVRFTSSQAVFAERCRGAKHRKPSLETVRLLCERHNDLGLHMGSA